MRNRVLALALVAVYGLVDAPIKSVAGAPPNTIQVPLDFPTIQQAIDAAADGDTVLVAPGIYQENLLLANKSVTLASHFQTTGDRSFIEQTVLDGGGDSVRHGLQVRAVPRAAPPDTRPSAISPIASGVIRNPVDATSTPPALKVCSSSRESGEA